MSKPSIHPSQQSIVLASNNQGKLEELQHLLAAANLNHTLISQASLGIDDAIEDGGSFVENALIKARHASRCSGLPAIADDSGLCVPALGGAPGIHSARYANLTNSPDTADRLTKDAANNHKLIAELKTVRQQQPQQPIVAYFVCILVMMRHADDPLPLIAQGIWQGQILEQPRGEHGFGYDPLFWLPELGKSAAELPPKQKNQLSHRSRAMQSLLTQLAARQ